MQRGEEESGVAYLKYWMETRKYQPNILYPAKVSFKI